MLDELDSSQTSGRVMRAIQVIGAAISEAIFSGASSPSRLGTSSPTTTEK